MPHHADCTVVRTITVVHSGALPLHTTVGYYSSLTEMIGWLQPSAAVAIEPINVGSSDLKEGGGRRACVSGAYSVRLRDAVVAKPSGPTTR